jgi:hypothetical protein
MQADLRAGVLPSGIAVELRGIRRVFPGPADPKKTKEYMHKLNPTMDAQTFKESAEAQKRLIENADTQRLGLGAMTLERWQTLVHQLAELKLIDKPTDPRASFVEPSKAK